MTDNLNDLNDHLYAQLNRLSDENMTPKQVDKETKRAKAIVSVSDQIVENAKLRLSAAKLYVQHGDKIAPHLPMIGGKSK
jgi:hypothetical protein